METAVDDSLSATDSPVGTKVIFPQEYKRMKGPSEGFFSNGKALSARNYKGLDVIKKRKAISAVDYFDLFDPPNLSERDGESIYGSAAKEIAALHARKMQILNLDTKMHMIPKEKIEVVKKIPIREVAYMVDQKDSKLSDDDVIIVDNYDGVNGSSVAAASPVLIIDSVEEDSEDQRECYTYQEIIVEKTADQLLGKDPMATNVKSQSLIDNWDIPVDETEIRNDEGINARNSDENKALIENANSLAAEIYLEKDTSVSIIDCSEREKDNDINATEREQDMDINAAVCDEICLKVEAEQIRDKGSYVGVEDEIPLVESDGLEDIWMEMRTAIEFSKDLTLGQLSHETSVEDCDHAFILKDDIGDVCRVCGFIKRRIENILDFQLKVKQSSRTYTSASQKNMDREPTRIRLKEVKHSENEPISTELSAHPRHRKQMKPHQIEGFNFLVSNLMTQDPGGCILAHAPGSGKTFMMICFIQIFLAKYPRARVLVVLPKGILPTWKKEIEIWKIEDIPIYDFYTVKAENRSQQLDVLNKWVEQKSILLLGYKQFSNIVCDHGKSEVANTCKDILLEVPDILILDEGHTSRNEETYIFDSLAKIRTPRRVILSGTLYQNHVKEVFNILNLVRPRFLKLNASCAIVQRLMSRIQTSAVRKHLNGDAISSFYDCVEHTLQKDDNLKRKECLIQDLREMTSKVLHYYKGDFLNDLPGLLDFTVFLNLSSKQKDEVQKIEKLDYFRRGSVGSLVYVHPQLKPFSEKNPAAGNKYSFAMDEKVDEMLKKIDVNEGVKARFFLNMLRLCESTGEKLLVFSQFLLPLKFLERLAIHVKGWSIGKELFMISGDSNSDRRERSMDQFNNSPDAKIFFGSIKACGEGISLVGASRILILDVHVNPSVTRQAIGRAFRPGQTKKVYAYRLVAANSPEEYDHLNCFKKELISKMWFEYNEYSTNNDYKIKTISVNDCGDEFLESSLFKDDVKVLYKR